MSDWNIQSCHCWWHHPWLWYSWQTDVSVWSLTFKLASNLSIIAFLLNNSPASIFYFLMSNPIKRHIFIFYIRLLWRYIYFKYHIANFVINQLKLIPMDLKFPVVQISIWFFMGSILSSFSCYFLINIGILMGEVLALRLLMYHFRLYISTIAIFSFCVHIICIKEREREYSWTNHSFVHHTICLNEYNFYGMILANCQWRVVLY